jgi:hypothetical protein
MQIPRKIREEIAFMRTPFDIALENHELDLAREIYALKHGAPRTSAYLVAWLRFSQRIRTVDDLNAARLAAAFRTQPATPTNRRHGSSPPRFQAAQQAFPSSRSASRSATRE